MVENSRKKRAGADARRMKPSWLPNWKIREQYPAEDAEPVVWQWNFLRRNNSYQDQYRSLLSTAGEALDEAELAFKERWGISVLVDPSENDPAALLGQFFQISQFSSQIPQFFRELAQLEAASQLHPELSQVGRFVFVAFDLDQHVGTQLTTFGDELKRIQAAYKGDGKGRKFNKKNPAIYIEYLRIYDAIVYGGIGQVAAGRIIFDEAPDRVLAEDVNKKAKKRLNEAKKMISEGYKYIY